MDGVVLGVMTQPRTHDHQPPSRSSQGRPPQRAVAQAMHQHCTGMLTCSPSLSGCVALTMAAPGVPAACTCIDMVWSTACVQSQCHWWWHSQVSDSDRVCTALQLHGQAVTSMGAVHARAAMGWPRGAHQQQYTRSMQSSTMCRMCLCTCAQTGFTVHPPLWTNP